MSGLKRLKDIQVEQVTGEGVEKPAPVATLPTPVVEENLPIIAIPAPTKDDTIWSEIKAAGEDERHNHLFCGVVGHEGTCKSGIVLDSLTDDEAARGDVILCIDFDGGGAAIRSAYHRNRLSNIRVLSPWVMQTQDRTAYDYPATHNRVMEIGRAAIDWAEKQNQEGYDGPHLHSLLVTAVDLWDSVATNCMKIVDLDAAPDGIAAVVNAHKLVGNRWNWQIRTTRFHQLTAICRRLMTLGVRVYWETHLKVEIVRDKETGNHRPDWEKHTNNYLNQIIWMNKIGVRDDDGQLTGETRYEAEFFKSKTNINLQGQRRIVAVTRVDGDAKWHGLSELREGLL